MAQAASTEVKLDRFGNPIDPVVGYARGEILRSSADEIAKTMYSRSVIKDRVLRLGEESVYDLSGLPRAYPLDPEDWPKLRSQLMFYAHFDGTAEKLAIEFMGGDPAVHDAVFVNRVSSGILAIAIALVGRGDTVVSMVPRPRSHPSIQRAVELVGGHFVDCVGVQAFQAALEEYAPVLAVATPITPSKFHMPLEDLRAFVDLARAKGATVFVDDAHMSSRVTFYGDPLPFQFAPIDLAILSTDKHIVGPRAGVIVGRKDLVARIRASAMEFGLESQSGHYTASLRALQKHDREPIVRAGQLAVELYSRLEDRYGTGHFYMAGPGIAISGEDALALAMEMSGKTKPAIVPNEAACLFGNHVLQSYGISTISAVAMPGSAPVVRFMMFPDGTKLGASRILRAIDDGFAKLREVLDQPEAARQILLGTTRHLD